MWAPRPHTTPPWRPIAAAGGHATLASGAASHGWPSAARGGQHAAPGLLPLSTGHGARIYIMAPPVVPHRAPGHLLWKKTRTECKLHVKFTWGPHLGPPLGPPVLTPTWGPREVCILGPPGPDAYNARQWVACGLPCTCKGPAIAPMGCQLLLLPPHQPLYSYWHHGWRVGHLVNQDKGPATPSPNC